MIIFGIPQPVHSFNPESRISLPFFYENPESRIPNPEGSLFSNSIEDTDFPIRTLYWKI